MVEDAFTYLTIRKPSCDKCGEKTDCQQDQGQFSPHYPTPLRINRDKDDTSTIMATHHRRGWSPQLNRPHDGSCPGDS